MTEESNIIQTELFIKHLQIDGPITATDTAEMTWRNFASLCSEDVVRLMKDEEYNGILISVTVRTPIVQAETIEIEG